MICSNTPLGDRGFLVRVEGLEPPCLAAPDPKSGMSTNFTTPAIWAANVGHLFSPKTQRPDYYEQVGNFYTGSFYATACNSVNSFRKPE